MPMNRTFWKLLALGLTAILVATACGSDGAPSDDEAGEDVGSFNQSFEGLAAYPLIVNSEIVVGENRILVGILNSEDAPIGSPDIAVTADLYDLQSGTEKVATMDMTFQWSIEDVTGVYVGAAEFSHPGKWGAEVSITGEGIDETVRTSFEVAQSGTTPGLGQKVPASDTLTLGDKPLKNISTDPHPDKSLYDISVADAVKAGKPFVLVFATPKFCSSAVCGPTLDIVKGVAEDFPNIEFIHVEPYELPADPSSLTTVPSTSEWGLPSEPWVFVVDSKGLLDGKYEGTLSADELRQELSEL